MLGLVKFRQMMVSLLIRGFNIFYGVEEDIEWDFWLPWLIVKGYGEQLAFQRRGSDPNKDGSGPSIICYSFLIAVLEVNLCILFDEIIYLGGHWSWGRGIGIWRHCQKNIDIVHDRLVWCDISTDNWDIPHDRSLKGGNRLLIGVRYWIWRYRKVTFFIFSYYTVISIYFDIYGRVKGLIKDTAKILSWFGLPLI